MLTGAESVDESNIFFDDDDGGPARLSVENSTFRESTTYGIYVETNQDLPVLSCSTNTFEAPSGASSVVGSDEIVTCD